MKTNEVAVYIDRGLNKEIVDCKEGELLSINDYGVILKTIDGSVLIPHNRIVYIFAIEKIMSFKNGILAFEDRIE